MSDRGVIIHIAATKSAGKSTVISNLATFFAVQGADTIIIDADRGQPTCKNWVDRRNEVIDEGMDLKRIHCMQQEANIKAAVLDAAQRYDAVFLDTGGRDSKELRTGLMAADIVFCPIEASQANLETLERVVDILDETEDINPNRIVRSFINLAPSNLRIADESDAREYMKEYVDKLPLSKNSIKFRQSYRKALRDGLSVLECNDSKSKAEIQLLGQEIMSYV